MEYARLGRAGVWVSRLCLGTNMFGARYVDDDRAISVVDAAIENGINFIDTADLYYDGRSEEVVGKAVKRHNRHELVIATKGFSTTGPSVNDGGLSRKHLIEAVEGSLRRLGTEYIDLYQVHWWDPDTPIAETLRTLDNLVRQGKIRYIGCSNFAAWQLTKALWVSDSLGLERFVSIQLLYNLKERDIEREVAPLCLDQKVGIMPYLLLMGGLLTGTYDRHSGPPKDSHLASRHAAEDKTRWWNDQSFRMVSELSSIALELGYSPAQIAQVWALHKPGVNSIIVGSSRPEQIAENARAVELRLPPDIMERLDSL